MASRNESRSGSDLTEFSTGDDLVAYQRGQRRAPTNPLRETARARSRAGNERKRIERQAAREAAWAERPETKPGEVVSGKQ